MIGIIILLILIVVRASTPEITKPTEINTYTFDSGVPGPTIGLIGGVHGNEKSGSLELLHLLQTGYFKSIKHGKVKVIPIVNQWGFQRNKRYNKSKDMNRIYKAPLTDKDALNIMSYLNDCDLVIDFHEGWSWNRISPASIGSTVTPSLIRLRPFAQKIVEELNNSDVMRILIQQDPRKQFDLGKDKVVCEISSTMECCSRTLSKSHILVEIPGQTSGHPMYIRRDNVRTVINCVLDSYHLI